MVHIFHIDLPLKSVCCHCYLPHPHSLFQLPTRTSSLHMGTSPSQCLHRACLGHRCSITGAIHPATGLSLASTGPSPGCTPSRRHSNQHSVSAVGGIRGLGVRYLYCMCGLKELWIDCGLIVKSTVGEISDF